MFDLPGLIDIASKLSVTMTPVVIVGAAWWVERSVTRLCNETRICRLTCSFAAQLPHKTADLLKRM